MTENTNMSLQENKKEIESQKEFTTPLKQYSPATDIVETDKELLLYMDMPGVSKECVQVKLEKNMLEVSGAIDSKAYSDMKPLYSEYNVGNFLRRFELSNEIDQEKIEANIDAGVLTLVLPKVPEKQPHMITVN